MNRIDRIVVYGSLGLRPGLSELLWAFRKNNKLEEFPVYLDDHPFQIYQRIKDEMKNGMRTADIVLMPHYMLLRLANEGLLTPHESKEASSYPARFHDRKFNWYAAAITFMSMAYNTKRLRPEDLPANLADLSSSRWKGKLGMQSLVASISGNLGAYYIAFLRRKAGAKEWERFVKSLAGTNRPRTFDCIDHLIQGLLDGSNDIALTVYSLAYFREKTAGSPVSLFSMEEAPQMLTFTSAGILKTAEENGSVKRFLDFLLSEQAQRIIGTIPGVSPSRPGIGTSYPFEVDYTAESDFHPDATELEELPGIIETFKKLGVP